MKAGHFLKATVAVVLGAAPPVWAQDSEAAASPVEPAAVPAAPNKPVARPAAAVEPAASVGGTLRASTPSEVEEEMRERRRASKRQEGFRVPDEDGQGRDFYRAYGGAAGLRPTATSVSGGLGGDSALGLTLGWGAGSASTDHRGKSSMTRGFAFIGGGGGGFEGGLGGGFYGGWRAPFGATHGPVARVGIFGMLAGNDLFYDSRLELPQGQLGYQIFTNDLFFEAGFQPGVVLAGRHDPLDGAARKLNGTFDLGAYASAWSSWLRLDLEGHRFVGREREGQGKIDEVRGSLCALLGLAAACVDGRYVEGDVPRGDGSFALVKSSYLGLLFGFSVKE
jgi:hypothetical protein